MTKQVQVVNADTAPHPLKVKIYDQVTNGVQDPQSDRLVAIYDLSKPGQMMQDYVFPGRYLIVVEQ